MTHTEVAEKLMKAVPQITPEQIEAVIALIEEIIEAFDPPTPAPTPTPAA